MTNAAAAAAAAATTESAETVRSAQVIIGLTQRREVTAAGESGMMTFCAAGRCAGCAESVTDAAWETSTQPTCSSYT